MRHARAETRIHLANLAAFGLFAAAAAFAGSAVGLPPIAAAEPGSGTWDIEQYDDCVRREVPPDGSGDWTFFKAAMKLCCLESGGVWRENDAGGGRCVAPPANSQGSRQIPADIATAPTVTQAPLRPVPPELLDQNAPVVMLTQPVP